MSALMSDVLEGSVTPGVSNACVNAGGKLLKVVDLQMRYGTSVPGKQEKTFSLIPDESPQVLKGEQASLHARLGAIAADRERLANEEKALQEKLA